MSEPSKRHPRELVMSVTKDDFRWDFFRSGGHGGQNVNKVSTGCRCVHLASGAEGKATDTRSQHANRKLAFERCVRTLKFQKWLTLEHMRKTGALALAEAAVDRMMAPRNIRVELIDNGGRWKTSDE